VFLCCGCTQPFCRAKAVVESGFSTSACHATCVGRRLRTSRYLKSRCLESSDGPVKRYDTCYSLSSTYPLVQFNMVENSANGNSGDVGRSRALWAALLKSLTRRRKRFEWPASDSSTDQELTSQNNCPGLQGTCLKDPIPDECLASEFHLLDMAIRSHVSHFYKRPGKSNNISRDRIEEALSGIALPWLSISELLANEKTISAGLSFCISWTILSRSLLLRLGLPNSPGSTFLPPEVVECFQSFSVMLTKDCTPCKIPNLLSSRYEYLTLGLFQISTPSSPAGNSSRPP